MQYQQRHYPPHARYYWSLREHSTGLSLDNGSRFITHPALDRQGLYQGQRSFPKYTVRLSANNIFYKYPNLDLR